MTKTKSRHLLDMLAEVPDLRNPRGKRPGLFSFRFFGQIFNTYRPRVLTLSKSQ